MKNDSQLGAPDAPALGGQETVSIGLRDRSLRLLMLLVFVLQLLAWGNLEGYQLADSVEYMERAQALVRGEEVIDSVAIRSFGFVSLLAPFFALADALGIEDFKPVVALVRLFQMLLGLELVRITVQLGARLAGRHAGLAAGLVVGLNPYLLLYSASPVSGIAAGVCIGHALHRLVFRADFRDGLIGGLWLGGALLVAYKTLLLALPLLALLALCDRAVRWRSWVGGGLGYAIGVLGAIGLDKLCYGVWGKSIDLYVRQNFGQLATRISLRLELWDLASWFWEYAGGETSTYVQTPTSTPREIMGEPNPLYHLTHLHQMVAWPLLVLGIYAVIRIALRGTRPTRILTAVFLIGLAAVSMKKSQEFRLMLPMLSCIGALCGLGWQWLFGTRLERRPIALLGAGVIAAGGILGWLRLGELNSARFSGYWRAMERVDRLASSSADERAEGEEYRVACTWHWAVFLRESAGVELIKLPHQLDRWPRLDEEFRADVLEAIAGLDAFITHLAVLLASPDLFGAVNQAFEVDAVLYDRETFENLGPIVVFERRSGDPGAFTFQSRTPGLDPAEYAELHGLEPGRAFGPPDASTASAELELLGWKYQPLPGDGHGWLSLHWVRAAEAPDRDFLVRPRILTRLVELPWEEQHLLGRGFASPGDWREGEILSEGWPVVAAVAPFDSSQPWRPLYADQPPGSTFPGTLWLRVLPLEQDGTEGPPLVPIREAFGEEPRVLADGFVQLGGLELIVPPRSR